ncbi:MAG: EFR1 family ferrodoxin, partial [Candidatus Rifleibacteriota bacterium]
MQSADKKNCIIYWYSGTGNSFLIAERIAQRLAEHQYVVELVQIRCDTVAQIPESTLVGLVFPIAVSGTYPFIWDFFERLPESKNNSIFMADTLGGYSGGIKGPLAKCLRKKGYDTIAALEFVMPENFPPGRKPDKNRDDLRISKALSEADLFVSRMLQNQEKWGDIPVFSSILGLFCRTRAPWTTMRKIFAWKIDPEKCSRCGLCIRLCPVKNIEKGSLGLPKFLKNCQTCMRCVAF